VAFKIYSCALPCSGTRPKGQVTEAQAFSWDCGTSFEVTDGCLPHPPTLYINPHKSRRLVCAVKVNITTLHFADAYTYIKICRMILTVNNDFTANADLSNGNTVFSVWK
jgi:hypothetical protein